jgi:hypothetical protein
MKGGANNLTIMGRKQMKIYKMVGKARIWKKKREKCMEEHRRMQEALS